MAQGPRRFIPLDARHDVVRLRLINPDRYLAAPRWIPKQHDRAAARRIEGDPGNVHFNHGLASPLSDYG